jgi:uncharacterized Zn-binding protein involved in type VI secretion
LHRLGRTRRAGAGEPGDHRQLIVGGWAEQRVDKPYHHACDAATHRWDGLPQLPRGAKHVGVAVQGDRRYAFGGPSNRAARRATTASLSTEGRGRRSAACPRPAARSRCIALADMIHLIGGRVAAAMGGGVKSAVNELFTLGRSPGQTPALSRARCPRSTRATLPAPRAG